MVCQVPVGMVHPMPRTPRRSLLALSGLLAIAAAAVLALIPSGINDTNQARNNGIPTEATILERDCTYAPNRTGGGHCTNLVAYTVNDQPHEVRKSRWNRPEGDTFTILVNPDNTDSFTVESLRTGQGTFRTITAVVAAALAAVAFAAGQGRPEPETAPDRTELAAAWAPIGIPAAAVVAAGVAGAAGAGAAGFSDLTGVLLTITLTAAAAIPAARWMRHRPQRLILTPHNIEIVHGSGKRVQIRLGPGSTWTPRRVQGTKNRRFVAVHRITDGENTATVHSSSWGRSDRNTSELIGNVLQSTRTPQAPKPGTQTA